MSVNVFVPSLLRPLCGGDSLVSVPPGTFGDVLAALDRHCPGLMERVSEAGRMRPELAVAVNGEMMSLGFHEIVPDEAELAIVPALGGG